MVFSIPVLNYGHPAFWHFYTFFWEKKIYATKTRYFIFIREFQEWLKVEQKFFVIWIRKMGKESPTKKLE